MLISRAEGGQPRQLLHLGGVGSLQGPRALELVLQTLRLYHRLQPLRLEGGDLRLALLLALPVPLVRLQRRKRVAGERRGEGRAAGDGAVRDAPCRPAS